jgi:type IV pilus assembly protein PilY1
MIVKICQPVLTTLVFIFGIQLSLVSTVHAAISSLPPLVKTNVVPNIFYTLDDSGSMQFEMMPDIIGATGDPLADAARTAYNSYIPCPVDTPCWVTNTFPKPANIYNVAGAGDYARNQSITVGFNHNITVARWRSAAVNVLYYDPNIRYIPWIASGGGRMPMADPSAALYNPVAPNGGSNTNTINLTKDQVSDGTSTAWLNDTATNYDLGIKVFFPALYYIYSGADGCSKSTLACFTKIEIKPATVFPNKGTARTDCPALKCTTEQEMQNFANWFQYHRSRILIARSASGEAFAKQHSKSRIGFGTINTSGTIIGHVSDDFGMENKTNFLNGLYAQRIPTSSTPLRRAIDQVGQYFKDATVNGPWQTSYGIGDVSTQLSCRQNYNILMTDGYWNGAGADSVRAGDFDANPAPTIIGPTINSVATTYTYLPIHPFSDTTPGTLADIGFYYWSRDLRPDWPASKKNVPITSEDPAFWPHLVQFTVGLGVSGSLNPATSLPGLTAGTSNWPAASDSANQIDDLWHTALNSRGKYFSAKDPAEFSKGLESALGAISARAGEAATMAKSSNSVRSGASLFISTYRTDDWSGQLQQKILDPTTGKIAADQALAWSASVPTSGRKVFTWASSLGKIFNYDNLDIEDQSIFTASAATYTGVSATQLADYLIGGPDLDQFRHRSNPLGDFVNSSPQYLKEGEDEAYLFLPLAEASAKSSYPAYLAAKKSRPAMVYLGGNDGMLHAFNGINGIEEFAYIPKAVMSNLPALASKSYTHKFYVDGTPTLGDAYIKGSWRTVLLGTTGAGGRSVFALDVSNPTSFNASNVMWEVNAFSDSDIGFTIGKAQLGRAPNGDWIAVFGNGYESVSNKAMLIIVNLANGVISKIDTGAGSATAPNGLATPRLVIGPDATIKSAYAGDLQGNLWKFNFTGGGATVAYSGAPLFTASIASIAQPITVQPETIEHPNGGVMVLFGTGKIFEDTDPSNTARQSLYGVWDNDGVPGITASAISTGQLALQAQTLSIVSSTFYAVTSHAIDWATKRGWYIDLSLTKGERLTVNPQSLYEQIIFTTIIPGSSSDPCVVNSLSTTLQLDALSGSSLAYQTIDTNGDGIVDVTDARVSGRQGALSFGSTILEKGKKAIIYQPTSTAQSGSHQIDMTETDKIALPTVRLWRQIVGKN